MRTRLKLCAAALGVMVLVACERPAQEPVETPKALEVLPAGGAEAVTFATTHVDFRVTHPKLQDTDFVTVEVLNPKGRVFYKTKAVLSPEGAATVRLPVRGGYIEDRNMTGTWSVMAYFNYAPEPFLSTPFEVDPG